MRRVTRVIGLAVSAVFLLGACTSVPPLGGGNSNITETQPTAEPTLEPTDDPDYDPDYVPNRWVPLPDTFTDANALVQAITVGWNLGNTLDANVGTAAASIRHNSPERQETHWGNVITSEQTILLVRDAGFNAIRIPVTWFAMVDENFTIREDWMDRVQHVVDYAYDNGMIVILNTHHDESMWSLFDEDIDHSYSVIEIIWTQIANRFRDYGQRLVFEGLNEPRTVGSENEWSGGTPEERNNVNVLNQVFVNTVRATGGNNEQRFLISSPYAASASAAAVYDFALPYDPAGPGKQIVSIHMYAPYPFALTTSGGPVLEWSVDGEGDSGPSAIIDGLDRAYHRFVEAGIPVIFGEMGAQNRNNPESRIAWADFYVREARKRGMRTFWWDNGGIGLVIEGFNTGDHFALFNRRTGQPSQPQLINAIMHAVEQTP